MRNLALAVALALFVSSAAARGDGPASPFGPWVSDASGLLEATDQALADLGRLADDPKDGLGPRRPNAAPFRSALALLVSVTDRLAGTLTARDPEFFDLLEQGSVALGALRVSWSRVGVRNDAMTADLRLASASYRLLRATYGREGLRHAQGGELSGAERSQFQRLQRTQRRLAADLERLREQARRRKDSALAAELDRYRAQATLIAWAPLDLASYLNALIATSEMRGEWRADAPYVKRAVPLQDWAAADQTVEDLWVDADIGKVFMVDLGKPGDGPAADAPPAVPATPIQTFQTVETKTVEEAEPREAAAAQPEPEEPQAAVENGVVEEEDLEVEDEAPPTADTDPTAPSDAAAPNDAKPAADTPAAAPAPAAPPQPKVEAKKEPSPAKAKPAKPAAPPAARHRKRPGIG